MTAGTMDLPFAGSEDLTYQIGILIATSNNVRFPVAR